MPQPNVLFIISDQHRWDFVGWETNGATFTPNLDRLRKRGATFRSAYCTAPLCSPSRQAIHSGRYGMNTGCFTNLHELPPGTPSFVGQFRKAGYRTCAVGKTHMEIHAYDSDLLSARHRDYMNSLGWDETHEVSGNGMFKTGIRCAYSQFLKDAGMFNEVLAFYRKWRYFMDGENGRPGDWHSFTWPFDEKYQETAWIAQRAVEWLEHSWDRESPFFLHVGFAAPHSPIEPFPDYLAKYSSLDEPPPVGVDKPSAETIDARKGYRAMITQVDAHIGRILRVLDDAKALDNTVFVYTADHGEMAGDRGRDGKCVFYEGAVRVPLIIGGPGVMPAKESRALVETIDLGRTICDICGIEPHPLDQGKSLAPLLLGKTETHRDDVYCEMGCDRMFLMGVTS
jgi:arylsulfatase